MIIFLGILFLVCLFVYGLILFKPTDKRIIEVTYESGKVRYRCEKKTLTGWETMNEERYTEYGSIVCEAIFDDLDDALRYIGKHPDSIIKSEKKVEI